MTGLKSKTNRAYNTSRQTQIGMTDEAKIVVVLNNMARKTVIDQMDFEIDVNSRFHKKLQPIIKSSNFVSKNEKMLLRRISRVM